jgi:DHA1 family multidrug resistance protein-like MFS transporter
MEDDRRLLAVDLLRHRRSALITTALHRQTSGAAAVMPLLIILVGFEMGVTLFGPLLPQVQQEFHISAGTVALALSAYHGVRLLINVPAGRLIARSSLTMMLAAGGVLLAVGAVIVGLAPTFPAVLFGRVFMGIGSAVFFITTQFWISKVARPDNKALLFSYNQLAALTGSALGPAVGGGVASWLSWRYSLILSVLAGLTALVAGRRLEDPTVGRAESPDQVGVEAAGPLRMNAVVGPGLIMMALFFFYGGMQATFIPLFAARKIQLGPAAIGGVLMLGTLWRFGAAVVGGRLATWFGTRRVVVGGLIVLAAAVLSFHLVNSPFGLIVAVTLVSWANLGGSLVVALITDLVPEPHWGTALGLNRTMADIGAMTAPILVGLVIDRSGFSGAITLVAGVLFGVALAAAALTTPSRLHAPAR